MQLYKKLMPAMAGVVLFTSAALPAVDTNEINERDIQAVEQFVQTKRDIPTEDKDEELAIAGQVRFEYQHKREKVGGSKRRGSGSGDDGCMRYGTNEYDAEFNLTVDYRTENTWAHVKLAFDNDAGVAWSCDGDDCGTGDCDGVCLERAYMGYRVYESDDVEVDVELGRRKMYSVLDSVVQFNSRNDGVVLTYRHNLEEIAQLTIKGTMFVIDSVVDNYGYAAEIGLADIAETGLGLKYSFIDWTRGTDRCGRTSLNDDDAVCLRAWNFQNSQLSATFEFEPEFLEKVVKLYGGFVYNHAAKRRAETGDKENIAWYAGVSIGKVRGEGDWSVDFNYQHVEAQSVPDKDSGGIGRGNVMKECFADESALRGNTNFEGFLVEALYGITDNLTVDLEFEWATEENSALGGKVDFKKYEVEFIYAF